MPEEPNAMQHLREPESPPAGGTGTDTSTQESTDTTQTQVTPPAHATLPPDFADTLAQSFGKAIAPHLAKTEPERKMTPEEARKALNVWEPDEQWFQQFGNLEQQKQAIMAMRDGVFKQNATYMHALMERELAKVREEFESRYNPVVERFSAFEAQQQRERLHKAYPGLADPAMAPFVKAVGDHIVSNKLDVGKSEAEAFKLLADGIEAVMRKSNPSFTLSGGASASTAQQQTKPRGNPNAQPVQSGGAGGGGGNGGGGGSPTGNRALDILTGKVKA